MTKKLREGIRLYLAPKIRGELVHGIPTIFDELNKISLDAYNVEHKIIIYKRQVEEWFLNRASDVSAIDGNGLIVLMICLSYIEGVQQYIDGIPSTRRSKDTFVMSLKRIYPNKFQDDDLREFYDEARNGLFHNGMIKQGVIYSGRFPAALEFTHDEYGTIKVNQKLLLEDIKKDFTQYIKEISVAGPLQVNFNSMFSVV